MLQFVKIRPQPARVGTKKAVPRAVPLAEGSNSSTTSLSTAALSLTKPGKLEVWSDEEDVEMTDATAPAANAKTKKDRNRFISTVWTKRYDWLVSAGGGLRMKCSVCIEHQEKINTTSQARGWIEDGVTRRC